MMMKQHWLVMFLSVCWIPEACAQWTGSVDALWLKRNYPADYQLARTIDRNANGFPGPSLDLSDVSDTGLEPGVRLTVQRADLEFSYFGFQEWEGSGTIPAQDPPFAQSPFLGSSIPFANKGFDTSLTIRYRSEIHSVEANRKRNHLLGDWQASTLAGVRFFSLAENLDLTGVETFTSTIEQTRSRAFNNLLGAQVGGEVRRSWDQERFGLRVFGKAGLYANFASATLSNSSRLFSGAGATNTLAVDASTTDLASLFEVGLMASVRLNRSVAFRAGYQVLHASGLTLAPDQLALTGSAIRNFPGSPYPFGTGSSVRTDGEINLSGPSAGVEVRF